MNKYAFIAVLVAIAIGLGIGYFLFSKPDYSKIEQLEAEKEKYRHKYDSALKVAKQADEALIALEVIARQDSIDLHTQLLENQKIKADGVKVQQQLEAFKKLTSSEKAQKLIDRYR